MSEYTSLPGRRRRRRRKRRMSRRKMARGNKSGKGRGKAVVLITGMSLVR
jgi:hypothetical protein